MSIAVSLFDEFLEFLFGFTGLYRVLVEVFIFHRLGVLSNGMLS